MMGIVAVYQGRNEHDNPTLWCPLCGAGVEAIAQVFTAEDQVSACKGCLEQAIDKVNDVLLESAHTEAFKRVPPVKEAS